MHSVEDDSYASDPMSKDGITMKVVESEDRTEQEIFDDSRNLVHSAATSTNHQRSQTARENAKTAHYSNNYVGNLAIRSAMNPLKEGQSSMRHNGKSDVHHHYHDTNIFNIAKQHHGVSEHFHVRGSTSSKAYIETGKSSKTSISRTKLSATKKNINSVCTEDVGNPVHRCDESTLDPDDPLMYVKYDYIKERVGDPAIETEINLYTCDHDHKNCDHRVCVFGGKAFGYDAATESARFAPVDESEADDGSSQLQKRTLTAAKPTSTITKRTTQSASEEFVDAPDFEVRDQYYLMTTDSMNDCRNFGGFTWGRPHVHKNCSITSDLLFLAGTDFYKYNEPDLSRNNTGISAGMTSEVGTTVNEADQCYNDLSKCVERDAGGVPELYETERDFSVMVDAQGFLTARAMNITRKNGKYVWEPQPRLGPGMFRMKLLGNNHPVCIEPGDFAINEGVLKAGSEKYGKGVCSDRTMLVRLTGVSEKAFYE